LDTKIIHVSYFLAFLESINEKNRQIQESLQDVLLDDLKNGQKIENLEENDVFITNI